MKRISVVSLILVLAALSAPSLYGDSRSYTHFALGYYYLYNDELELALDQFESSLLYEDHPPALLFSVAAEVSHLLGKHADALKYANMAIRIDPWNESALQTLSLIYISDNDYESAVPYLERLREKKPEDMQVLLYLAEAYNALEDDESLIGVYSEILIYRPDFIDVALNLGYLYTKKNVFSLAEKEFDRVLELDPENEKALFYLTYISISTGKTEQAVSYFRRLDDKNLLSQDTLQDYALNLFIEGQNPEPITRRIENWEEVSPALLGISAYLEGNLKEAKEIFQQIAREEPDNLAALAGLVRIAEAQGERDEEKRWRFMLAGSYYRYGRYKKALEESLEVKVLDPTYLENRYLLGDVQGFLGNTEEAIEEYEYFERHSEEPGDVHIKLGIAYDQVGEHESAIASFRQATVLFPENDELFFYLGIEYRILKDYPRAVEVFKRAVELNDQDPRYYFQLGVSYERLGMIEQAIVYLDRSVQLDDSSATVLNYLGYLLADEGKRLDEAKGLIEKALSIDPENAAYLDSMGWVLYHLRDFDGAKVYLESAVQFMDVSDEENYVIYEHLGDVYYIVGQVQEAVEAWEEALEMKYSEEIRKKIDAARKDFDN
jgi:tetratricopeptide (TPR) repeat protein